MLVSLLSGHTAPRDASDGHTDQTVIRFEQSGSLPATTKPLRFLIDLALLESGMALESIPAVHILNP